MNWAARNVMFLCVCAVLYKCDLLHNTHTHTHTRAHVWTHIPIMPREKRNCWMNFMLFRKFQLEEKDSFVLLMLRHYKGQRSLRLLTNQTTRNITWPNVTFSRCDENMSEPNQFVLQETWWDETEKWIWRRNLIIDDWWDQLDPVRPSLDQLGLVAVDLLSTT